VRVSVRGEPYTLNRRTYPDALKRVTFNGVNALLRVSVVKSSNTNLIVQVWGRRGMVPLDEAGMEVEVIDG
jgi:hypothetical protein